MDVFLVLTEIVCEGEGSVTDQFEAESERERLGGG
jgi:hypothetical protein